MFGWQPLERLAVWGGPTLNVMVDDPEHPVARPGYGWASQTYKDEDVRVRMWPGFVAGVRF